MIKHIEYGENWSPYYQKWRYPYTEEEARQKHIRRELYTALITQHDGSHLALELCFAGAYCNIYFHDALGRNALTYVFEPTADGRLFLSEIAETYFRDEARLGYDGVSWSFTQTGLRQTLRSRGRGFYVAAENEPVDVSTHFEPLPPFGQWESLIRRDRSRPPA